MYLYLLYAGFSFCSGCNSSVEAVALVVCRCSLELVGALQLLEACSRRTLSQRAGYRSFAVDSGMKQDLLR